VQLITRNKSFSSNFQTVPTYRIATLCRALDYMVMARRLGATGPTVVNVAMALMAKDHENEKALLVKVKDHEKELLAKAKDHENEKALLVKDHEKELLAKVKDHESENALLMQSLLPLRHRQAVEELVRTLDRNGFRTVKNHRGGFNMSASIELLRKQLQTNGYRKPLALKGAATIYSKLSEELHRLPLPLTIQSARWWGLTHAEAALMDDVYRKLNRRRIKL
jgi:hypothetical protein